MSFSLKKECLILKFFSLGYPRFYRLCGEGQSLRPCVFRPRVRRRFSPGRHHDDRTGVRTPLQGVPQTHSCSGTIHQCQTRQVSYVPKPRLCNFCFLFRSGLANGVSGTDAGMSTRLKKDDHREYYNDLPGKVPPDLPSPPPVPPLPQYTSNKSTNSATSPLSPSSPNHDSNLNHATSKGKRDCSVSLSLSNSLYSFSSGSENLIDLSTEGPPPPPPIPKEPQYANESAIKQNSANIKDPFDMRKLRLPKTKNDAREILPPSAEPFSMQLNQMGGTNKSLPLTQRLDLQKEIWFHGPVSRRDAELLLKNVSFSFS